MKSTCRKYVKRYLWTSLDGSWKNWGENMKLRLPVKLPWKLILEDKPLLVLNYCFLRPLWTATNRTNNKRGKVYQDNLNKSSFAFIFFFTEKSRDKIFDPVFPARVRAHWTCAIHSFFFSSSFCSVVHLRNNDVECLANFFPQAEKGYIIFTS